MYKIILPPNLALCHNDELCRLIHYTLYTIQYTHYSKVMNIIIKCIVLLFFNFIPFQLKIIQ